MAPVGVTAGDRPSAGEAAVEARAVVGVPSSGVFPPLRPRFWSASASRSLPGWGRSGVCE